MSGIDLSGFEVSKMQKGEKISKDLTIAGTNQVSKIPEAGNSSIIVRSAGGKMAAIPAAAAVEVVKGLVDVVDHAIQAFERIAVETERTKQVKAAMYAQIRQAEEQTRQVEIQARERTAALVIQAKHDLESKLLDLEKLKLEMMDKQKQREFEQEVWRKCFSLVMDTVNLCNQARNDVWDELKKSSFQLPELSEKFDAYGREVDGIVNKLISQQKRSD